MRNRHDHGVHLLDVRQLSKGDSIKAVCFLRIRLGIHHQRRDPIFLQLVVNVDHLGVSGVGAVFLKGKAEDRHLRFLYGNIRRNQVLDQAVGDIGPHVVIDSPAGENDLAVVAHPLRLIGQIIGIHPDAVSADQPRKEFQEVPFGTRGFQNGFRIDSHLVEDHGQFIHEGNVDVSLRILNDLGCFRHLNGLCPVDAGKRNQRIYLRHLIQRLFIHTGNDLGDGFQAVHLVSGIDSLGGVSDLKVHSALQSRLFLQNRLANVFCHTGIHRGLIDHNASLG